MQTDYLQSIQEANTLVTNSSIPSPIDLLLKYNLSVFFTFYFTESGSIKSAKKWASSVTESEFNALQHFSSDYVAAIQSALCQRLDSPILFPLFSTRILPSPPIDSYALRARMEHSRGNHAKVFAANHNSASALSLFSTSLQACSCYATGRKHLARLLFQRCSLMNPEDTFQEQCLRVDLAMMDETTGDYAQAIEKFTKTMPLFRRNPLILFHFAECLLLQSAREGKKRVYLIK